MAAPEGPSARARPRAGGGGPRHNWPGAQRPGHGGGRRQGGQPGPRDWGGRGQDDGMWPGRGLCRGLGGLAGAHGPQREEAEEQPGPTAVVPLACAPREPPDPLHTRGARARTLTWEPQSAPAAPSPAEASRPSEWSWRPRGPCGDREGLRGPPCGGRRPAAREGRAPETEPWASGGRVLDTARAAGGLSLAGGASSQRAEVAGSAPGGQAPAPTPAGTALASHGCRAPAPAPHGRTLSRAPAAAARCFLARATGHSE